MVGKIYKAKKNMHLQSKGGNMITTNKTKVAGYKTNVWFDQKYITNLITLNNLINKYHVTYDRKIITNPQKCPFLSHNFAEHVWRCWTFRGVSSMGSNSLPNKKYHGRKIWFCGYQHNSRAHFEWYEDHIQWIFLWRHGSSTCIFYFQGVSHRH